MAATALYLRISQDDDSQDESFSIANQRDLLEAYVATDPVLSVGEVLIFADDGWSGTNFERPQVKALLDLVRRGGVQNILVKDLSRWGRNYPVVSEYLDQIFPFLGVRFISVNDDYDSETHKWQTAPMTVAFSSIVHDMYSKELSVKVKQAHVAKAKNGEYVCGTVPYGFTRSDTEKNRLVVDHEAAAVIQRIFDMACEGISNINIAATLNAKGIDSPLEHRRNNGRSALAIKPKAGHSFWNTSAIRRVLGDERYTGTLIYCKTKKSSRTVTDGKRREVRLPEADWVKVPDALPAIISTEQFGKVKASRHKHKGHKQSGSTFRRSPFVGKVVCGHCGQKLKYNQTGRPFFRCSTTKSNAKLGCYNGMVRVSDLEEVFLSAVKSEVQKALDLREKQQKQRQGQKQCSSERDSVLSELKRLTVNVSLLEQRGLSLYEDFAEGKIEKDAYVVAKTANNTDLEAAQTRIAELNGQLADMESKSEAINSSCGVSEPVLHRVLTATEATVEVMTLLDRMVINDGGRIEVRFAFKDTNA